MKEFTQWYAIGATIFVLFGMFRAFKYKINHDELTVISWFLAWPIWIISFILYKIFQTFQNKKA